MRSRTFMLYPFIFLTLALGNAACDPQQAKTESPTGSSELGASEDAARNETNVSESRNTRAGEANLQPERGQRTGNRPVLTVYEPDTMPTFMAPDVEEPAKDFFQSELKGGQPAPKGDYPWASLLTFNYDPYFIPFCSGALVAKDWVLTAAHCAVMLWQGDVAFIGGTDLALDPGEPRFVDKWLCHPQYDADAKEADLALVRLETSSTSPSYLPLAGPNSTNGQPEQAVTILGYGETNTITGPMTAVLHVLDTTVVAASACQTFYTAIEDPTIGDSHICAGDSAATTCSRDSGGPLFVSTVSTDSHGPQLEGIGAASFVGACTTPGGFSRISKYQNWIDDVISNGSSATSCP